MSLTYHSTIPGFTQFCGHDFRLKRLKCFQLIFLHFIIELYVDWNLCFGSYVFFSCYLPLILFSIFIYLFKWIKVTFLLAENIWQFSVMVSKLESFIWNCSHCFMIFARCLLSSFFIFFIITFVHLMLSSNFFINVVPFFLK